MSSRPLTLVWLRNDLRIDDNPALAHAAERGAVLPVWIRDDTSHGAWAPGAASRVWTHHALEAFSRRLTDHGVPLLLRRGDSLPILRDLVRETGATTVVWNRRIEPAGIATDARIKSTLREDGLEVRSFAANLLFEPWQVETKQGDPYKVFTPFWRTCLRDHPVPPPVATPTTLHSPDHIPDPGTLAALELLPAGEGDWADRLMAHWEVGEEAARNRLEQFIEDGLFGYDTGRDVPGADNGVSRLSPYLHHGEIGVRTIWARLEELSPRSDDDRTSLDRYRAELGWREFAHHLLYHFPATPDEALRPEFNAFPWADDPDALAAWQRGRTGFPMVDAGMRQLWETGYQHNRVRMITASFLTKDLLIPWQAGARWFWDALVDADLASNTLGWQWTAGCGADAAPYFRVFNPTTQGMRYDPEGMYVRRWIPELAGDPDSPHLPGKRIHEPAKHGLELGDDRSRHNSSYPVPIVDHGVARTRALTAYDRIKTSS